MNRLLCLLSIALAALLTACGTAMPLKADTEQLSPTGKPLYLMTVTMVNNHISRYQPWLQNVRLTREDGGADKQKAVVYKMDSKGMHYFEDSKLPVKYLVRFDLESGKYTVNGLFGSGRAFPFNFAAYLPLQAALVADKTGVFYLGEIKGTIRERQGNEFRAGPLVPLIDQAVAGMSTGTFEVEISDKFDEDMALFRTTFPALKTATVEKAVLPPFDRPRIQKWWEDN